MRIAIFNWRDLKHPQGGGAELYLHEQAKRWVKNGHKVTWFASDVKNSKKREIVDGIDFIRKGGKFGVYLWAIINYFKHARNCDVIIDAENGIPFFTPLYSRKRKILLVHHIHKDVWFKEFKFPISWIGHFLETRVMPRIYRKTRIVTVSESSKKEINNLMPKNDAEIVYNAISSRYMPGKKNKTPEIVFVGRLKKYKSIDILLRAVAGLDKNLVVNIVGRGDDEERLKKISRELGLRRVVFHGFVSDEKKLELLQRAWIAVNPSFVEGWSITNIEANASGTVVIGSNVPGIRDSIIDNKTGMLFKYGNHEELGEKIKMLIENKKLRLGMEKEALSRAKNFSWDKSSDKFIEIMKNNNPD